MSESISPMSLPDIFDRMFRLIGKTAFRNVIIAGAILLPAAVIVGFAMDRLFSVIADMASDAQAAEMIDLNDMSRMGAVALWYLISLLFLLLASLAATLGITIVACGEMSEQKIGWGVALQAVFGSRLLKVYGQVCLEYLALACLLVIPFVLVAALAAIGPATAVVAVLIGLLAPAFAVYLWVNWAFALTAIAWEDAPVIESFRRSTSLVRGRWWRTFGILLLLNIVAGFALSLIITPIGFAAQWGYYSQYFASWDSLGNPEQSWEAPFEALRSAGVGFTITFYIQSVLSMVVVPLIGAVIYFDLRARRGEFVEPAGTVEGTDYSQHQSADDNG